MIARALDSIVGEIRSNEGSAGIGMPAGISAASDARAISNCGRRATTTEGTTIASSGPMVDSGERLRTTAIAMALTPATSAGVDQSETWVRVSHAFATLLGPVAGYPTGRRTG